MNRLCLYLIPLGYAPVTIKGQLVNIAACIPTWGYFLIRYFQLAYMWFCQCRFHHLSSFQVIAIHSGILCMDLKEQCLASWPCNIIDVCSLQNIPPKSPSIHSHCNRLINDPMPTWSLTRPLCPLPAFSSCSTTLSFWCSRLATDMHWQLTISKPHPFLLDQLLIGQRNEPEQGKKTPYSQRLRVIRVVPSAPSTGIDSSFGFATKCTPCRGAYGGFCFDCCGDPHQCLPPEL